MLIRWWVNLPEWLQVPLSSSMVGLFSLAVTATLRPVTAARRREGHNDVMGPVFGTCSIMYALLLGFVFADLFSDYQSAEQVTTREAATLVTLYADTGRYPDPPRSVMQDAIRQYTRSVVADEFPAMATGRISLVTRTRLSQLYRLNASIQSGDPGVIELNEAFNTEIDDVTVLRQERLLANSSTLPGPVWLVLVLGSVVTIVMAASLFMEEASHQLVGAFLLGVLIGALLLLILLLDRPFIGTTAISMDPYQRSLRTYTLLDEANRPPSTHAVLPGVAAPRPAPAARRSGSSAGPAASSSTA